MWQPTHEYCLVNSSASLKGISKPVSKDAFSTTGSVPQLGPAATGAWVGAWVAAAVVGASVATDGWVATVVAGACVAAGAAVVAGVPQAGRSKDAQISRLAKDHNKDFLFISASPYHLGYGSGIRTRCFDFELDWVEPPRLEFGKDVFVV